MNNYRLKKWGYLPHFIVLFLMISMSSIQGQISPIPTDQNNDVNSSSSSTGADEADILAVVVKSWNNGQASAWTDLNDEWPFYGSISIFIDTTTLGGVSSFTYQDLVNTGADVIILANPAGGNRSYSASEIEAISQYISEGHNIIGTHLVFQYYTIDNRGLAPAFGINKNLEYKTVTTSNQFNQLDAGHYLFTWMPGSSWTSEGYPASQVPADFRWDPADLSGAELVAEADDYKGVVSVYDGENYSAVFISNMPEYYGGMLDKQLLYNAITYRFAGVIHVPGDQPTIQTGIDAAFDGYTVRVADGTYAGPGNRDLNFSGKAITVRSENGPGLCIIDCESEGRGFYFHSGEGKYSVLEGFTIQNGYADGRNEDDNFGGGIYCREASPTIRSNIITGNDASWSGGGICCNELSDPIIMNNIISENAARSGGGISCRASSAPTILNNRVIGNAAALRGGGIYCHLSASPALINNLITHNTARYGGGIHGRDNASPVITGSTITANMAADFGGGILCNDASLEIANAILWDNEPDIINIVSGQVDVSYSDILGGYGGTGNIDADPLFVPGLEGYYYLSQVASGQEADSPCVDAGDPATEDFEGTTRIDLVPDTQIIDMGYHYPHTEGLYICSRPSSLRFTGGDPDESPPDQIMEIWRCGTGILEWSLSSDAPWITFSPASGNSDGEIDQVTVHVDTDGLTAGEYRATITLDAAGAVNAPALVPVLLMLDYTAVVAGPGPAYDNPPHVRVFIPEQNAQYQYEFGAYGPRHYGVNVSCGDVTGDGFDEIITGAGPGAVFGPHVRGFGRNSSPLPGLNFMAYGTRKYGVNVACGDLDGDDFDEILTGAGPGAVFGPHVRAFNYDNTSSITPVPGVSFMAYGTRLWGANVTGGDLDGDGYGEIITGPGPGPVFSPHVRGWNVDGGPVSSIPGISFFAYRTSKYGCVVSCGDVDGDGFEEIVTAPGPSLKFGSHIGGWDYDGTSIRPMPGYSFFAWPPSHVRYGARIFAGADLDRDGTDELVVGAGPDPYVTSPIKVFRYEGIGIFELFSLEAFPSSWTHGVNVAAGRL